MKSTEEGALNSFQQWCEGLEWESPESDLLAIKTKPAVKKKAPKANKEKSSPEGVSTGNA